MSITIKIKYNKIGRCKMARPRKWRKVCSLPYSNKFGPLESPKDSEVITMMVDEYESIRLIDLESLTQEECAQKMNIARTTVQRIYSEARKKIAESLIEGKVLLIEGGDYKLCNSTGNSCGGRTCGRRKEVKIL